MKQTTIANTIVASESSSPSAWPPLLADHTACRRAVYRLRRVLRAGRPGDVLGPTTPSLASPSPADVTPHPRCHAERVICDVTLCSRLFTLAECKSMPSSLLLSPVETIRTLPIIRCTWRPYGSPVNAAPLICRYIICSSIDYREVSRSLKRFCCSLNSNLRVKFG